MTSGALVRPSGVADDDTSCNLTADQRKDVEDASESP